jgi:hypothetical protein
MQGQYAAWRPFSVLETLRRQMNIGAFDPMADPKSRHRIPIIAEGSGYAIDLR